jgi:nucleotidyltransferase substrate binding protein (TIGR01987 family)
MSALNLTSLKKAIASLEKAVIAHQKKVNDDLIRDAAIKRFEYIYELCSKMLRCHLEITEAEAETVDQLSFPDLIRLAAERGLVEHSWDVWNDYRKARNITNHTYDEEKAQAVSEIIPSFLEETKTLLQRLNDDKYSS